VRLLSLCFHVRIHLFSKYLFVRYTFVYTFMCCSVAVCCSLNRGGQCARLLSLCIYVYIHMLSIFICLQYSRAYNYLFEWKRTVRAFTVAMY